jgi:hypothetical protein
LLEIHGENGVFRIDLKPEELINARKGVR